MTHPITVSNFVGVARKPALGETLRTIYSSQKQGKAWDCDIFLEFLMHHSNTTIDLNA
jgi:hypothetical protein